MLSVRGLSILPRWNIDFYSAQLNSSSCKVETGETQEHKVTWRASDMTEEIIDREQLLAAFNELGVEEVDEAVSFQF